MTPAELSIVSSVITIVGGVLAAAVRWGFGRLIKAMDDNTAAMVQVAASNARLDEKIEVVFDWVVEHTTPRPPPSRQTPSRPVSVIKDKRP